MWLNAVVFQRESTLRRQIGFCVGFYVGIRGILLVFRSSVME